QADLGRNRQALPAHPAGPGTARVQGELQRCPDGSHADHSAAGNGRELLMAKWGLVPFWTKPESAGKPACSTINARAESIQTAASYREPFRQRRCLVPASGWYEWQKLDAKKKRPIHMRPAAAPFALAGVYDVWKGGNGHGITSFAIVTTDAAPSVAEYHDRMPVVL